MRANIDIMNYESHNYHYNVSIALGTDMYCTSCSDVSCKRYQYYRITTRSQDNALVLGIHGITECHVSYIKDYYLYTSALI